MTNGTRSLLVTMALILASPAASFAATGSVSVYKTPWCGCCHEWAEAGQKAGYQGSTVNLEHLSQIRRQAGVPANMEGCHVASVDDYFLEGHVPLEAVDKLLSARPAIAGLAVPGMPRGSLGMADVLGATYEVYAVQRNGSRPPAVFYVAGSRD